jgi:dolichyl-phosphate-mannose-protein mannosyltransferase
MVYIYLILGLLSLFFMGYAPVYFLLAGKGGFKVGSKTMSGGSFIFFISFFTGSLMAAWLLIMLSITDIGFTGQVICGVGAVSFIFYVYNYMSRKFRNRERKSINRLSRDITAARQSRRIKDKKESGQTEQQPSAASIAAQIPLIKKKPRESKTAQIFSIIFTALIIINLLVVVFLTVLFPIRFWDAISCWSIKGIAFFIDGIINNFYIAHDYGFSHPSYPLYLPLMQTWLLSWMGEINENILKITFPLFYLSLLSVLYYLFRQKMGKLLSVMLVFIVSVLPIIVDHGYIEYTNLLFSVAMLIAIYFFYLAKVMKGKTSFLILSAIFFSIMALTRSEGIIYVILFIIINIISSTYGILRKDRPLKNLLNLIMPLAVFIIFLIPWYLLKIKLGLPMLSIEWSSLISADIAGLAGMPGIKEAYSVLGSQLILSIYDSTRAVFGSFYGPIWILMLIAMLFSFKSHFKDYGWIFFIFLFTGMVSIFISLALISDFANSTERYILHLFPTAYYWIMSNSIGKGLNKDRYVF